MTTYVCKECNYRLESKSDKKWKKCPYCGKSSITEEKSAEDLVLEE